MTADREIAETRANALLKEYAITAEQERSASITLADVALTVADGQASLRDVLEAAGLLDYQRALPPHRISNDPYISYERPGK
jgi:hypothetical protein